MANKYIFTGENAFFCLKSLSASSHGSASQQICQRCSPARMDHSDTWAEDGFLLDRAHVHSVIGFVIVLTYCDYLTCINFVKLI